MNESFSELFEESIAKLDLRPGSLVKAKIIALTSNQVVVNAGLKSDAVISMSEFPDEQLSVGDSIDVVIETVENGFGETRLSREKARRARTWLELEKAYQTGEAILGTIVERVKGGFTVEIDSVRAFLPGSLVDVKPVRDPGYLEGKSLEFKIIKMDQKRNNVVLSRRAILERETSAEREARLDELQEGQEVIGVVKNITDYGAFLDLGGIDGLLHVTDISWKRVKHPSEVLKVGEEHRVKILKFDREKNRISLGMKQLMEDPWRNIARRYPKSSRVFGVVSNITDYGCFVELEEGVEGLVHMTEMDWTNKNIHPSKVVQLNDEVEVMVLEVDEDRRRISLGIKQCKANPWQEFADKHQKGEKIKGKIRSITDFGIFVGLEGDIDGLIHLTDISWNEPGEQAVRKYSKGEEVEAIILGIDPDRERISLSIRQLEEDPVTEFMEKHDKNANFEATVTAVEAKRATVQLADQVLGQLRISEYSYQRTEDLREELKEGDKIEVKVINVDRKNRQLQVSHKATQIKPATKSSLGVESTKTTLGDLLKEQMKNKEGDEGQD
ncbi:MAG: 30S ribosomal protein S1 [Proteobacteria bacterium]|nr:30S ribosomal protein S1 [Pseudomonadota bacterium]